MIILLVFFSLGILAAEPLHWGQLLEVTSRHEFYKNNEVINKPKNSWQQLFAVSYIDRNLNRLKDCVFYYVPGTQKGALKIKTISSVDKCENYILSPGEREIKEIKSLEFEITDSKIKLFISLANYKSENWEGSFQSAFKKPEVAMKLSSAAFKSPRLILLAPVSKTIVPSEEAFLKEGSLCHDINEDCEEVSKARCDLCQTSWYEVPNGCEQGPKYCGDLECGSKGNPACRRGMKWQKKSSDAFDCRTDSSFAYCSEGLDIVCEGRKAFCR